jgi:hypothetical protein
MKNKITFHILLFLFLFLFLFFDTSAQFCVELPNNIQDIESCNKNIAEKFSPRIHQWSNVGDSNNPTSDFDRIVKVNFDGDWLATNNWHEMTNFLSHDVFPSLYYNVLWTEDLWLIQYTFYFARDWANGGFECDEDEHEGDFVKVLVIAKRATNSGDKAPDLLLGFSTSKGDEDCIEIGENAFVTSDRIQPPDVLSLRASPVQIFEVSNFKSVYSTSLT